MRNPFTRNCSYLSDLAKCYLTILILFQLFVYFQIGSIFHGSFLPLICRLNFVYIWATSILLTPFIRSSYSNRWRSCGVPEVIFLASTFLFVSLVALREPDSVMSLLTAISVFIYLVLCPSLLRKKHFCILFWFACALAGLHALSQMIFVLGQMQTFLGFNINMPHGRLMHVPEFPLLAYLDGYTGGWYTNPNCLASYIMAVPAIALYLSQPSVTSSRVFRFLAILILCLSFVSLLLTFSRAAIMSVMLGMIPPAVYICRQRKVPIVASLSSLAIFILGFFLFQMSFTTLESPFSLTGRASLWDAVFSSIKHLPALGYGPFKGTSTGETPHNVYLANLLFYGPFGLISLVILLISSLYLGWRFVNRKPNCGTLALFGFVVAYVGVYSQFEFVLTHSFSYSNSLSLLVISLLIYLSKDVVGSVTLVEESLDSRKEMGLHKS